jgi:hypothetical protein
MSLNSPVVDLSPGTPDPAPPVMPKLFSSRPVEPGQTAAVVTPDAGPGIASEPVAPAATNGVSVYAKPAKPAAAVGPGASVAEPPPAVAAPESSPAAAADPLAIAEAAAERARARSRRGAQEQREIREAKERADTLARRNWELEQRANGAEGQIQDVTRLREMARSPDPAVRAAAGRALGLSITELDALAKQENTPEARLAALEARHAAERAADRAALKEIQDNITAQAQLADMTARQQRFVAEARAVKKDAKGVETDIYPEIASVHPEMVIVLAKDLLARAERNLIVKRGFSPRDAAEAVSKYSNAEVLAELNKNIRTGKPAASAAPRSNQAPPSATATQSSATPRTVTSSDKNETLTPPKNFDDLPEAEQKRILARIYRASADSRRPSE